MSSDASKLKFFSKFERHSSPSSCPLPPSLTNTRSLFNCPTNADLTITCHELTFPAHHNILSLHTPFFSTATTNFSGATTATVDLPDHSTATVTRFLKWCYTGDYPTLLPPELANPDHAPGELHLKVYFLADYLGVEELKELAARKYRSHWVKGEENEFIGEVREVWENTCGEDDKMRAAVLQKARKWNLDLKKLEAYREVLMEVEGFAVELAWNHF